MRVVIACALSFVLALIVGIFLLARTAPMHKPQHKPEPAKPQTQAAPNLEMLPALPSFPAARLDVQPNQYEEAGRLLKAGRYREAENAYLQIVMRQPHEPKAIEGLVASLRLRANQDPQKLQEGAAAYRRAIVEGRVTEENYTPREMELLAEASLSAANGIKAEQRLRAGVSSRVAMSVPAARPAESTSGNAQRRSAIPTAQPIAAAQPVAKGSSVDRPRHVSQTRVAATVPASGASRPPATPATVPPSGVSRPPVTPATVPPARVSRPPVTSTTVPPAGASRPPVTSTTVPSVGAPPRETGTSGSPIGPRQVPVTQPTADSAQPQTSDATQVSPSGSVAPDAYVLGPGDQIEVNIPHLAATVTIKQDGMIALPLISPVKAAGKTTAQLASDLNHMYSKVLDAPSVTVFVRQSRVNR
jgi:Polysaccharide biosynthesis/export protein